MAVIISSDHHEMLGSSRLCTRGKYRTLKQKGVFENSVLEEMPLNLLDAI